MKSTHRRTATAALTAALTLSATGTLAAAPAPAAVDAARRPWTPPPARPSGSTAAWSASGPPSGNFVSWRLLASDAAGTAFNVYRDGVKVNAAPITTATSYLDAGAPAGRDLHGARRRRRCGGRDDGGRHAGDARSPPARTCRCRSRPAAPRPDGESYTYTANDASVGDLDGDGQYEIVLKWDPTNAKDNSQSGYTGNVYRRRLQAQRDPVVAHRPRPQHPGRRALHAVPGVRLRRRRPGRGGDEDRRRHPVRHRPGDRQRRAPTTATRPATSWPGPEFLTVFRGTDGAVLATANYVPPRGTVSSWGDNYGNRVDRFLAGTAYVDGSRPSIIMARGYYTRSVDRRVGLPQRRADPALDVRLQLLHQRLGVDRQGQPPAVRRRRRRRRPRRDHVRLDGHRRQRQRTVAEQHPPRRRLPRRRPHPVPRRARGVQAVGDRTATRRTGWATPAPARSSGARRPAAATTVAASPPTSGPATRAPRRGRRRSRGLRSATNGTQVASRKPGSTNFVIWWDGDAQRELLDGTHIDKYGTGGDTRLLTGVRRRVEQRHQGDARRCRPTSSATGARRSSGAPPTTGRCASTPRPTRPPSRGPR